MKRLSTAIFALLCALVVAFAQEPTKVFSPEVHPDGSVTFRYTSDGRPEGLCRAKTLDCVTTSGGYIGQNDFGYSYIDALARNFFGIPTVHRYAAEGLDIFGNDPAEILRKAKADILL